MAQPRPTVPALDEIIGDQFKVLDDGFVRLVDYMGNDDAIVQAARVSYGAGTKKVQEDRALIRYLMRHAHTTPFEMCELKLHVRVPMDCWRQWIRHRTANVNEYSTRYSIAIDAAQRTAESEWRSQSSTNRQGSGDFLPIDVGAELSKAEADLQRHAREVYEERLKAGVAREQARKDLPLSTYTEAYWKVDLHNLLHFLRLRSDPHAQAEIRAYANVIGEQIVARWCPVAWQAFDELQRHSVTLTSIETSVVRAIVKGDSAEAINIATRAGLLNRREGKLLSSRERSDLESKLRTLDLAAPWNVDEVAENP